MRRLTVLPGCNMGCNMRRERLGQCEYNEPEIISLASRAQHSRTTLSHNTRNTLALEHSLQRKLAHLMPHAVMCNTCAVRNLTRRVQQCKCRESDVARRSHNIVVTLL